MRALLLLFLAAASAWPQIISFGVKAGLPFTDFLDTASSGRVNFSTVTNRYLVGPTAELHLPAGLGLEVDALYRHFSYQGTTSGVDTLTSQSTTAGSWEFPILLKYRFPTPLVKPFVDGGVAFNTLTGLNQTITNTVFPSRTTTTSTTNPAQLNETNTMGLVLGAGLDIHALFLHVSPSALHALDQPAVPGCEWVAAFRPE